MVSGPADYLLASALLGREFGKILSKPSHWIRLFGTGIAMAILAILLVSIGAMVHAALYDASVFAKLHSWKDYFIIYGLLVATITLIIGVWLLPLTGIAAIYFNRRFFPRLKAIDDIRARLKDKPDA